jgi:CheY-like chemotaxis protein
VTIPTTNREVLIVEDDEAIATGLKLNLRLAGHNATIAGDGEAAMAELAEKVFDLVLLDINLPRKNGLEVLGAMRDADNIVPVIVLSARDGEYDKVAALRLGADDYVTKPFARRSSWRASKPSCGARSRQCTSSSPSPSPSRRQRARSRSSPTSSSTTRSARSRAVASR